MHLFHLIITFKETSLFDENSVDPNLTPCFACLIANPGCQNSFYGILHDLNFQTTPYATSFRRRFFVYHHTVKHPIQMLSHHD